MRENAGMLEKKLLTLGCAVGILACGACFLPPLPEHQPPPPPVRLDFHGIRKIRVEVINNAAAHGIDPDALGGWIEFGIKTQARAAGVKAFSQTESANKDADAVLHVNVLSETAVPVNLDSSGSDKQWNFQVNLSAVLAKKDGTVIWGESDGDYRFSRRDARMGAPEFLNRPDLRNWLTLAVGQRLVARMLNAE
jgi:hypothetical protein